MASPASGTLASVRSESKVREFFELTKPRLSLLSVITAMVGYAASVAPGRGLLMPTALFAGTALSAGACGALNQYMEREYDAAMVRTRGRPIPSGAVSPAAALAFGIVLAIAGLGLMWVATNPVATLLTAATIVSYLFAYTPLKRLSPWCTVVGSVPGALPPLIGCATALNGGLDWLGWSLCGVLFCWQIPHFMALAWMYRRDYAEGRFVISTLVDPSGRDAARQSIAFTFGMLVCSLAPVALGFTSRWLYPAVAVLAGGWFLMKAVRFMAAETRDATARPLFLASILYLPLVLVALLVDVLLLA